MPGNGIPGLKAALPDGACGYALFKLQAENVGNTGAGIVTNANIILQVRNRVVARIIAVMLTWHHA